MSDAFSDAIRARERYERGNEMCVFVVVIRHKTLHDHAVIGPAYWNELLAQEECKRLNEANSYTRAYYVARWLPYPTFHDGAA